MSVIVGKIIFWLMFLGFVWGVYKLWKSILNGFFPNPTKKLLKGYLVWVDFLQGITSIEEFKKRLSTIEDKIVYKDEFNHFYLTKEEAFAQNKNVEELLIKEVLKSETYPLYLIKRCERITLYSSEDLKNIDKTCKMVWITIKDIVFHMILKDTKFFYPKDYTIENVYRFGYTVLFDEYGLKGLYDIDNDKLCLPFEYKYIDTLGNIAEVSKDGNIYEIHNVETKERLQVNKKSIFPNIPVELKEKINLTKIELKDYMKLFSQLKSQNDLKNIGLWGQKVGVMKVPSYYVNMIEDSSTGIIQWHYPISASIFDMSIELPIQFIKKDGSSLILGIEHRFLILEDREILKQKEGLFSSKKNINKSIFEVYIDDSEDCMGNNRYVDDYDPSILIDTFFSKEEAIYFIEQKIDTVLRKMKTEAKNIEEFKSMDIPQNVSYFIKIDYKEKIFFKTWEYIQNNAKRIFEEKSQVVSTKDNQSSSQIGKLNSFQDLLKRGNLPDDDREVPLWLQIKNKTYKTIPSTKEIVDDIVSLDDDEFMQYINKTINQNIFFTALSCAKDKELERLYKFLENGQEEEGLTTQFRDQIEDFKNKDIKKEQLDFALMVVSLYAIEAKNTFSKFARLYIDMNQSNFSKDDESLFQLEYSINALFFHSNYDLYKKIKEFISTIKELYESTKISDEFCTHIASKFAPILNSIDRSFESEYTNLEYDLKWFIDKFIKDELVILKDESILHQLILLHSARLQSVEEKNPEIYFEHTVTLTRYYLAYSAYLKDNALFYLDEIMDFVAKKEITVDNANAFIEVFEVLPALYEEISYENVMAFKELINRNLATSKPQNNKIFDKEGVKNKLILLNYKIDMEDLYQKSGKDKKS